MKKFLASLFAIALTAASGVYAADFEGVVTMKTSGPRGTPSQMTFSLTKGRSRIDMKTSEASPVILFDAAKEEMTILMPEQKIYFVQPAPKAGEIPGGPREDATLEKTSETEKILGYECTKYLSRSSDGATEVWLTDQLGTFLGIGGGNPMAGAGGQRGAGMIPDAWAMALRGKDAFPLRVITREAGGTESFRMEATAVEKKTLPASTFLPPANYQKFDLQGMMRGMGLPPGIRLPGGG